MGVISGLFSKASEEDKKNVFLKDALKKDGKKADELIKLAERINAKELKKVPNLPKKKLLKWIEDNLM